MGAIQLSPTGGKGGGVNPVKYSNISLEKNNSQIVEKYMAIQSINQRSLDLLVLNGVKQLEGGLKCAIFSLITDGPLQGSMVLRLYET